MHNGLAGMNDIAVIALQLVLLTLTNNSRNAGVQENTSMQTNCKGACCCIVVALYDGNPCFEP